ncbi:hypothetical protein [Acaryochloris sp. CCMEE 5410]|uniref:hypothetical protein n=1 Tax=Acaryochloris sp. CCMEE 5410 TaxID=310037 RepID=UPI00024839DD|nr:hypothetical protein [Acaryochloris sp. CCMEE 5410]KAI9129044.1 hypothetical protein ON05_036925 [Acaryochloris sp. CCMEE 5410]
MLSLVEIAPTIAKSLVSLRSVFCRDAEFAHISRYLNGLFSSPNKTLQVIYSQLVWPEGEQVSYRPLHLLIGHLQIPRQCGQRPVP